jgi:hypothetical protein
VRSRGIKFQVLAGVAGIPPGPRFSCWTVCVCVCLSVWGLALHWMVRAVAVIFPGLQVFGGGPTTTAGHVCVCV